MTICTKKKLGQRVADGEGEGFWLQSGQWEQGKKSIEEAGKTEIIIFKNNNNKN